MASERDFGPNQLAQWLGLEPRQFRRAQARGLIPPPDIDDERWSLTLAKTVPDRLEEIAAALGGGQSAVSAPAPRAGRTSAGSRNAVNGQVFGPIQLAKWLGLENWQVPRGVQLGVIPPPDVDDKRWAEASVTTLPERVEEIRSAVGDHPGHGSIKAAEYLAERTKKDVERVDVQTLAAQGLLHPVAEFKGHPMYSLESLDTLPEEQIAAVVRRRHAWIETSLTPQEAAKLLGWPVGKFEVTAERRGLTAGPLGRFPRADVEGLRT